MVKTCGGAPQTPHSKNLSKFIKIYQNLIKNLTSEMLVKVFLDIGQCLNYQLRKQIDSRRA